MKTRLTMAQALVRFLRAQYTEHNGERVRLLGGVFAIFGHGNVAGLGEAPDGLYEFCWTWRDQHGDSRSRRTREPATTAAVAG